MNRDTIKLIAKVEETTGYKVSVGTGTGFSSFAHMSTATPQKPIHSISVNPEYSNIGDYIVALQCAMILVKWSHPSGVPVSYVYDDKVAAWTEQCLRHEKLAALTPESARQYAGAIVKGLILQLLSIPMEIMAINICKDECPSLADMMKLAISNEIQEQHQSLEGKIRKITPDDIFEKNAAMNAAFAFNWSRISGDQHILAPFMATNVLGKGKELMRIYDGILESDTKKCTKVVDGWAQALELASFYKWKYMER